MSAARPAPLKTTRVLFGIDQALSIPERLKGRIGLVTNAAAQTARDPTIATRVALQRAGLRLVRLFSPEHGLHATAADGTAVSDSLDPLTGVPVVSLYGPSLQPATEHLKDLDTVVFDIPDIGARFYTYIWTLWHVLEACAEAGKPLVVLDRPNPLGGEMSAAEGPILDLDHCSSFLGRAAIPIRHSLTVGELARLWNSERNSGADVQVIPCAGWKRAMHWPENNLPFIQTSPAIPNYASALLYPGLCLFEAANLSVGRGMDVPFQIIGAPWLKAEKTATIFNSNAVPGLTAEAHHLAPNQGPFAGERCAVVRLRVTAPKQVRPVAAGLRLLAAVIALHPENFRWATYPTAANPGGEGHFEKLIGQRDIRETLEATPEHATDRIADWTATPGWTERVKNVLLYE